MEARRLARCWADQTWERMGEGHEQLARPAWAWIQLAAGLVCLGPVVWSAHFYVAHDSDNVSVAAWVGTGLVVGILWGPLLIMAGAVLMLMHRARLFRDNYFCRPATITFAGSAVLTGCGRHGPLWEGNWSLTSRSGS